MKRLENHAEIISALMRVKKEGNSEDINRDIQNKIFDLTKNIQYEIPLEFNVNYLKKDLVKEHVFGRKYAANKIMEFFEEDKLRTEISVSELYNFLTTYCKYVRVPRNLIVDKKTINGALRPFQNKKNGERISFIEYIKTLDKFGLNLTNESYNNLKDYMCC